MAEQSLRNRFRRRRWLARLGRLRTVLLLLLGATVVGAAAWLVYGSSVLGVQEVRVEGTRLLSVADVESAAAVTPGAALASLDVEAVAARVADLDPVADVEVRRDWPHGLVIDVREREPIAAVSLAGRLHGMDDTGVLYRTYATRPQRLPLVEAGELADERVEEALGETAAALSALDAPTAALVDTVQVTSIDGISFGLRGDRQVVWGSAGDAPLKAEVLAALLEVPARVYDVSVPSHPTTRD